MFSWDTPKALKNYEKHSVTFEEATTIFADADALDWEDLSQANGERRWKRLGFSIKGRVLVVVYTLRTLKNGTETIRIISARQASKKERKAYGG